MLGLRDISIRNKLILMQVLTSVVVLGVIFSVFIVTDIRNYKQRKEKNLQSIAQVIGMNNISAIQFQANEEATRALTELRTMTPEVVHAAITDSAGHLFAAYTKHPGDTLHIPRSLANEKIAYRKGNLYVKEDIVDNGRIIGRVVLESDMMELAEVRRGKIEVALILLLVAIGIAYIIAYMIQNYTSGRLLNLVTAMKEVGKTGDYNKSLEDKGRDEIGQLIVVFNSLMQQVKISQQKKDEFIGIASHELKTPLTTIKGYAELLRQIEDREPHKIYAERTVMGVEKLERLIKDLLDVSKIQSGQLKLTMQDFNIDKLIDDTIASVQIVSETHKITREDSLGNEVIAGDQQRIEQVITNLLSNAIKYSPGQNKVVVNTRKTDKDLIIKIRDYGLGIPKDEQSNIFERFYRTKDISFTITGFGLGLYICRDIIRRHNGKIWVESEDRGSAFYFSLPLKQSSNGQ